MYGGVAILPSGEPTNAWGTCIRVLLARHNLSLGAAAAKTGKPELKSYLSRWCKGHIPQYMAAIDFLEHFPREEAIECLQAAGYPIPAEWSEVAAADRVREQMAEYLVHTKRLTPEDAKEVLSELQAEPEADPEEWEDRKSA